MSRWHFVACGVVAMALAACDSGGEAPKSGGTTGTKTATTKASASATTKASASAAPSAPGSASASGSASGGPAESASPTLSGSVSASASAAGSAPASGSAATSASAAGSAAPAANGIPDIPSGTSPAPKMEEWDKAAQINTQGPNSSPKDCYMKIVREWLKVHCDGKVTEVKEMEGFGPEGTNFFQSIKPGKSADLVVRLRKGETIKARILREDQDAVLFVNWPTQEAKPTNIALGIGKR